MLAPAFSEPEQTSDTLVAELAALRHEGAATVVEDRHGLPFFFDEFWTARQRQGHALHEVSYRACFKPQLPEFFIARLTAPGDRVYDPFMGRGTTPIQAALMGRAPVGNDINPLSICLTRPRTAAPDLDAVARRLAQIDWTRATELREDLLVFYHPGTLAEICALRAYLIDRQAAGTLDAADDWIRMVALNRLTGHSPGFFSVYSLPPNQAVSVDSQRRINAKRAQIPPRRSVPDLILKKSRALLKDGAPPTVAAEFHTAPADRTADIAPASIDLVVTSPPFLDIVQYAADNWLRCWFAGIDAGAVQISTHRKVADWTAFVARVFAELERIVRPGGHVAFEVGEVRGGTVELETLVLQAMAGLAFQPLGVLVNTQQFTKTANVWGVANNALGVNTNRVVLSRRL
jgi:hypothetical protein